jgi:hypothetical protein
MSFRRGWAIVWSFLWILAAPLVLRAAEPSVDLTGYRAASGISVKHEQDALRFSWRGVRAGPLANLESVEMVLDLRPERPLIKWIGCGVPEPVPIIENADPVTYLVVGSREAPAGRPPGMSVFNTFFDAPAKRSHQTYRSTLDLKRVRVTSQGRRTTVAIGDLSIGPFTGELQITAFADSRLIQMETVIRTAEDRRAILYDTGLVFPAPAPTRFSWLDTEGRPQHVDVQPDTADQALAVRNRLLIATQGQGFVACFPPPHQFFTPRDLTDNLRTVWYGKGHRGLDDRFGFGIRQSETGGGSFVPWFNAPPGTEQRLGVFYLLSSRGADEVLDQALSYTHNDQFPDLPGYRKFTTHWHMAITMAALAEKQKRGVRSTPDFVRMFRAMGIDIVHLAEFHGDGHPQNPGPIRLAEMQAMFDECRRLSDHELLFLPGEEANIPLGLSDAGKRPGHWVYLFPGPVYWTMKRAAGQPFEEQVSPFGTVYHVGDGADLQHLLAQEHGLAWTSHPRIKGSSWTPDIFRNEDFYLSDRWLGAAWKAMPADLSHDRLGRRALDLLDDMANWGQKKYLPGEVDVFKIDHTHELYGHMNINYIRFDGERLPRFDEGWQPVLDSLRAGRFFVSTGEVLIPEFTVDGQPCGSTVALKPGQKPDLKVDLTWTFPMRFLEVISGDGSRVYRERVDLADTGPFDKRTITLKPELTGRRWVRVEAWDVATNGAFTQPVWLSSPGSP